MTKAYQKYLAAPKLCWNCQKVLSYAKRYSTFCGHACSSIFMGNQRRSQITAEQGKELIRLYKEGLGIDKCSKILSLPKATCYGFIREQKLLRPENFAQPIEEILIESNKVSKRGLVKYRLIKAGILKNECQKCGLKDEWQGQSLVLILDHINGRRFDYRLQNLRLLCPNCNSQTETFCSRNNKYLRNGIQTPPGIEPDESLLPDEPRHPCRFCQKSIPMNKDFCNGHRCFKRYQSKLHEDEYLKNPKHCGNCQQELPYAKRKRTYCSNKCSADYQFQVAS